MVRLATIEHNGCRKLVAQIIDNNEECEYFDLTPVCRSVVDYFASPQRVQQFLPSAAKIPAKECRRLLAPMDGSRECGKFICIGMNYKVITNAGFGIFLSFIRCLFAFCILLSDKPFANWIYLLNLCLFRFNNNNILYRTIVGSNSFQFRKSL